jgi:hypothetical protein
MQTVPSRIWTVKTCAVDLFALPTTMPAVDLIITGARIVVRNVLEVTTDTKKNATTGTIVHPIAASDLDRLLVAMITTIVAPGLHLRRGGILMRENLQGTMITDGEVMMMTAEPLIIIMTAAGTMIGDVKTAVADATRKTIGTTTGQ